MIYDKVLAEIDTDEPGIRTAKVLNMIADTLEMDLKFTYDVPSNHSDLRMPVLDLKI